jgi:hypothetical protein
MNSNQKDTMRIEMGRGPALRILNHALEHTHLRDMRTPEVKEALTYLRRLSRDPLFCDQFWVALGMADPTARWENFNASINGVLRQTDGRW